ncbi:MAG TPA: PD-(D/E)XK nuclease family protein [Planctomycetota bacterium]|nr:PD-(D/E)XK nuclease family protein [Planctomycetota bacterium]
MSDASGSDAPPDPSLVDPEDLIVALTKVPEYKELQALVDDFDIFSLFDSALEDNSWKHGLSFLFNSRKGHGLGPAVFREWLAQAAQHGPEVLKHLIAKLGVDDDCEFRTMNDLQAGARSLDILVEILDQDGQVKAVLAIEDKSGSGGGYDPFFDYQEAIAASYPDIPKLLIYLVNYHVWRGEPEPRYFACCSTQIDSVIKTCDKLEPAAQGNVRLLFSSIRTHIERRLLGRKKMDDQAREIIHRMFQRREHRQAFRLISQFAPTIRSVVEEMHTVVGHALAELPQVIRPEGPIVWSFFPKGAVAPKEIKLEFSEMSARMGKHGINPVYVLDCETNEPDVGDIYTLRLMAWWNDENARQKLQMLNLRAYLPAPMATPEGWASWEPLWVGNSYRLEDIGEKDIQGLSAILVDGIAKTYSRIRDRVDEKLR